MQELLHVCYCRPWVINGAWTFGLLEEPGPKSAVAAAAVLPPVGTGCCGG